ALPEVGIAPEHDTLRNLCQFERSEERKVDWSRGDRLEPAHGGILELNRWCAVGLRYKILHTRAVAIEKQQIEIALIARSAVAARAMEHDMMRDRVAAEFQAILHGRAVVPGDLGVENRQGISPRDLAQRLHVPCKIRPARLPIREVFAREDAA